MVILEQKYVCVTVRSTPNRNNHLFASYLMRLSTFVPLLDIYHIEYALTVRRLL